MPMPRRILVLIFAVTLGHGLVLVALYLMKVQQPAGGYAALSVTYLPASAIRYEETQLRLGESPVPQEMAALPVPLKSLPAQFLPVPTESTEFREQMTETTTGTDTSFLYLARRNPPGFAAVAGPGKGLLKGREGLARHVQEMARTGLDVVFVFDTTESMAGVLTEVKGKIKLMMRIMAELVPGFRVGMVAYRDYSAEYVTKPLALTNDLLAVYQYVESVTVGMGYRRPEDVGKDDIEWSEAVYAALEQAINFSWRPTAKKVVILIGDAPPHPEELEETLALVRSFWKSGKGIVHTIFIPIEIHRKKSAPDLLDPKVQKLFTKQEMEFLIKRDQKKLPDRTEGLSQKVEEIFRSIAMNGGGECVRLQDEKEIVREMLQTVLGRQWKVDVDEIYDVMKGK